MTRRHLRCDHKAAQVVDPQRLTLEELATYNGTEACKPIYLAIRGVVFDVTAGARQEVFSLLHGPDVITCFMQSNLHCGCCRNGSCYRLHKSHKKQSLCVQHGPPQQMLHCIECYYSMSSLRWQHH